MSESSNPIGHPIRIVSKRTGLSTPVIRAWERRYGAVEPSRSPAGQRVYSDADIRHLQLLAVLVRDGQGIGTIATLTTEELESLVEERASSLGKTSGEFAGGLTALAGQALDLVEALRPDELEKLLMRSALAYRVDELVSGLMVPLLREIGEAWQTGRFGPGSEHVASVPIRRFLEWLSATIQVQASSPLMVTGTPAGQRHEFGALLAGVVAADEGWRVRFLGPDLPADEIARGATTLGADAVSLSALYPPMVSDSVDEVMRLRERLPALIDLIIGGAGAEPHADTWPEHGITWYADLDAYRKHVRRASRSGD